MGDLVQPSVHESANLLAVPTREEGADTYSWHKGLHQNFGVLATQRPQTLQRLVAIIAAENLTALTCYRIDRVHLHEQRRAHCVQLRGIGENLGIFQQQIRGKLVCKAMFSAQFEEVNLAQACKCQRLVPGIGSSA